MAINGGGILWAEQQGRRSAAGGGRQLVDGGISGRSLVRPDWDSFSIEEGREGWFGGRGKKDKWQVVGLGRRREPKPKKDGGAGAKHRRRWSGPLTDIHFPNDVVLFLSPEVRNRPALQHQLLAQK